MDLQNKPDLDKTMARWEAWWHCQIIDRPVVTINLKEERSNVRRLGKQYSSLRERWMDIDFRLEQLDAYYTDICLAADNLPTYMPNLGPEICGTLYGCELEFGEHTSWSRPIAHTCQDVPRLKLNLDNPYWNWIRQATEASIQRGKGRWITCITDLHTNGDLLASLRDPQELLLEMAEDFDAVKAAMQYLTPHFLPMFDDLYNRIHRAGQPIMSWCPCPHVGRSSMVQCDLICMMGPQMFREAILPALAWEVKQLDRSLFHLDGPGALQHLDDILDIPGLNGVQWVYGAGNGPAHKWIDVYKRIQARGKCMHLMCENIGDALKLMDQLKPQGCWFAVNGEYTLLQVDEFLATVTKWAGKSR